MDSKFVFKMKKRKIVRKFSDCCNNKVAQSELEEQLHFLQTLIDAIPSPIFYKDTKGIYRGCNKAYESFLGLTKNQIVTKGVHELFPTELADKYYQMDNELFQKPGVQVYESKLLYADSSIHNVVFNKATYVDTKKNLAGLVGIVTDITERIKTENAIKESSEKLYSVLEQVVKAMAMITETRDMYTAGHQKRVAELGAAIAKELNLSEERVKAVEVAGMLHDIGKIAVPAEILTKPGTLTINEFAIVKEHCEVGYNILKTIDFPWPIADIVYQHHERSDGSGYPRALCNKDILIEAQIIAVADVVEAMSSHRPYRPSLGLVQAITEINRNRGLLYDADVVAACINVLEKGFHFV